MRNDLRRASFLGALGGAATLAACAGTHSSSLPFLGGVNSLGSDPLPSNESIGEILHNHFSHLVSASGGHGKGKGFVVAVTHGGVHGYYRFGELTYHLSGKPVFDFEDALFFIGSNTKVFTGIMLALAVLGGEVTLDTHVADLLPSGVTINEPHGPILLRHLATHSAGYPDQMCGRRPTFGNYPFPSMTKFLKHFVPPYAPGTYWSYSDPGFALLGLVISNALSGGARAKLDGDSSWPPGYHSFWQQVVEQVGKPLGMVSTQVDYAALRGSVVQAYINGQNGYSKVAPAEFVLGSAGLPAGALSSTPSNMLNFLDAQMGLTNSRKLKPAIALALKPHSPDNFLHMGLGWQIGGVVSGRIIGNVYYDKNGGIPGYTSYMAFDSARQWGIVALSNTELNDFGTSLNTQARLALGELRGVPCPTSGFPLPPKSLDPQCND